MTKKYPPRTKGTLTEQLCECRHGDSKHLLNDSKDTYLECTECMCPKYNFEKESSS